MYCNFYGLTEKPFVVTPNPRYVFLSRNHREAFAHLLYGIDNHAGFIELTGEVGTGKTTVLRTLLGQLDDERYRIALVFNPTLSAIDLLGLINREFGIPCDSQNNAELLNHLYQFLLRENAADRTVVLVVDEAQNLTPQVLEQVRLISNLETDTDKLIQIVLAGQPELAEILGRPELSQINQRITVRYHLRPMDFDDTRSYVDHRLDVAGGRGGVAFSHGALKRLYRAARGIPRLINVIGDRVLLIGYAEERRQITARMMGQAIAEIGGERRQDLRRRRALAVALAALLVTGVFFSTRGHRVRGTPGSVAPEAGAVLFRQIAAQREADSAREALNAVLAAWKTPPVSAIADNDAVQGLAAASRGRGLAFSRFDGSLGLLQRLDLPAVLEIGLPDAGGRRFLALTGADRDRLFVKTSALAETALTSAELERIWGGRAYVLWRDPLRLKHPLVPWARERTAKRLQQYLQGAGIYDGKVTGRFDLATMRAVQRFQSVRGIPADGRVGELTLLFICRAGEGARFPHLVRPGEVLRP
jgi:general secretion pathway protein A